MSDISKEVSLVCKFSSEGVFFNKKVERYFIVDLSTSTILSSGFYFSGFLGNGKKSDLIPYESIKKVCDVLHAMKKNETLLQKISKKSDRHLIKADVEQIHITLASYDGNNNVVMTVAGTSIEQDLESVIAGTEEYMKECEKFLSSITKSE